MSQMPMRGGLPSMVGFSWTTPRPRSALSNLPGDLWCVRDAFSELMGWPPGTDEWGHFIEAPLPADMDRLCDHLGLVWYDPDRQKDIFGTFVDHLGIAVYVFHTEHMSHAIYQPHLKRPRPLPLGTTRSEESCFVSSPTCDKNQDCARCVRFRAESSSVAAS